ncbi:DMT family transporter [uncultured Roseovarius sp.]|uniref:DMT family transporter n=1 Tax=uncultured Roseovarius sp. TaxID=293344 RepID=UPI002602AD6A|nr:DMT family transporter [uncultured Roseovarius sp.]
MTTLAEKPMTPVILAFLAAALWGIWWIPIRYLETLGMDGAWGSVAMNVGATIFAVLWIAVMRVPFRLGVSGILGAALVGVAVSTYSVAITMSDVVRVILLFYLAPGWGKIIEWAFMGRGWHWTSTLTIAASLLGAWLVLGGDLTLAGFGAGDLLAVLSGMAWAGGAALIFTGSRVSPSALTLVTCLSATLIGLGFILLGQGTVFSGSASVLGSGMGALSGVVYVLPIMVLTLWSAQRLPPATISFLLTAEILSGVLSGVLFLDEPFGAMQAGGAALILFAATAEVFKGLGAKAG